MYRDENLVQRLTDPVQHLGVPASAVELMREAAERIKTLQVELECVTYDMIEERNRS